jgi:hypothetical protein
MAVMGYRATAILVVQSQTPIILAGALMPIPFTKHTYQATWVSNLFLH